MRAPSLGHAAVLAALLALSTCLRGFQQCPRSLDCARAGREFCLPGGSQCGPCLRPLVENSRGRCVVLRKHASHAAHSVHSSKEKVKNYPELDEEIDFLSAVISEQRTESKLPAASEEPKQPSSAYTAPSTNQSANQIMAAPTTAATNHTPTLLNNPVIVPYPINDHGFIVLSSVFIMVGSLAVLVAGACWVRLQKGVRLTQKVDYPGYGQVKAQTFHNVPGDKKLAHSAQMYHYLHQKQQMLSLEKHRNEPKVTDSGASTDEENEDGDFTVYECPGLAPTGEMEVKNPLFDDSTLYLQRYHK